MINRRGRTAFHSCHGKQDLMRNSDATPETIYRIYSMTKPLTAVAIMMLYERVSSSLMTRSRGTCLNSQANACSAVAVIRAVMTNRIATSHPQSSIHRRHLWLHAATPVDAVPRAKTGAPRFVETTPQHDRAASKVATYRNPESRMELLTLERCTWPSGRRHFYPAIRRVSARACNSSARHGRYRILYSVWQGQSFCGQLPKRTRWGVGVTR